MTRIGRLIALGWADTSAASVRALGTVLFVAALVALGGASDLAAAGHLARSLADLADAGAWVAVGRAEVPFPSERCRSLNGSPDVLAAGAVGTAATARFGHAPGAGYRVEPVTPELLAVLAPSAPVRSEPAGPARVGVGPRVAAELGLVDGSVTTLAIEGGEAAVVEVLVLPDTERTASVRGAVLVPTPSLPATECVVSFAAGTDRPAARLERILAVDGAVHATPLLTGGRFAVDPWHEYAERPTARWPQLVAAVLAVHAAAALGVRRRDLALLRALGFSRSEAALIVVTGAVTLALGGACLGVLVAAGFGAGTTTVDPSRIAALARGAAVAVSGAALGAIAGATVRRGSLAAALNADPGT